MKYMAARISQISSAEATGDVLLKKCSQKFRKNSQENTCAKVSFLKKLHG